jgi:hypothetical protein
MDILWSRLRKELMNCICQFFTITKSYDGKRAWSFINHKAFTIFIFSPFLVCIHWQCTEIHRTIRISTWVLCCNLTFTYSMLYLLYSILYLIQQQINHWLCRELSTTLNNINPTEVLTSGYIAILSHKLTFIYI